ncbi:putative Glycoside hydrolase family 2 sugar binding [uncultured spirochete]|jgi:beta-galactosidase/beta-glucuronidase|uniref:Putative Glycoside hydrolase family 2 sugar binding n=1 Tax=uncultured spirochete TaxID=156406 RepID=A0A3P3XLB0_9SPIR|nr:sugar-binding domain-containing protein [Rectinema subterraneum]SLM15386.1 putative Glycoside hydrolase family 2 sugar binding [uncultured spirochete]
MMKEASGNRFVEDSHIFAGHPNPSWARRTWMSLDGIWTITHRATKKEIRVPFPIGSKESGVDFKDSGLFVYEREFILEPFLLAKRYLLHIGACDYMTTVFVNGHLVGSHVGGYASFSFDITSVVKPGKNRIEIRVLDSHSPFQVRGKQTFMRNAFFVWYEGIAGIWQSVWLEEVGLRYLERAETSFDFFGQKLAVSVFLKPLDNKSEHIPDSSLRLRIDVKSSDGRGKEATRLLEADNGVFKATFGFDEFNAALWSIETPNLHPMALTLLCGNTVFDTVETYFGLREISAGKDGFKINGKPVFLKMVLNQGYYPGGVYTPLDYSRMAEDIRTIKALGYNGARIHEKVEAPYFHYLCDRLGLLTSFEMPSFYLPSKKGFRRYESELKELILRDSMHPSCIMRMLFNETWGIWGVCRKSSSTRSFVEKMYRLAKHMDPTRPVIENSGWEHFMTDIVDFHHYLRNASLARNLYSKIRNGDEYTLEGFSLRRVLEFYIKNQVPFATRSVFLEKPSNADVLPLFLSEYGGFGWYDTEKKNAVEESIEEYTRDIVHSGLFCGYCYTQLYDVGSEVNGLMTFERNPKVDIECVRKANNWEKQ